MASTIIAPIGQTIKAIAASIAAAPKTYWTDPGFEGLDSLPAVIVGVPSGSRRQPDEAEDHISQTDWHLEYPVSIVCDLAVASDAQTQIVEILESFVEAIDDNQASFTSGLVLDAVVSGWLDPEVVVEPKRALLTLDCTVSVFAFDS